MVYVYDYTGGATSVYESGAYVEFYGSGGDHFAVDVPTDGAGER